MNGSAKILVGTIILLVVAGLLFLTLSKKQPETTPEPAPVNEAPAPTPTTTVSVIGKSVEGREIESHVIGNGDTDLLFIGGIHGGYEWNSAELAYEIIDYFDANPNEVPENITIHIIPNLNPDGLHLATGLEGKFTGTDVTSYEMHETGEGRFNSNDVDLNRNFDCRWDPDSTWRGRAVSGGTEPFSEPEAAAIRDYVLAINPVVGVVWHSRANNVYGSECGGEVAENTLALMNAYAEAADYGKVPIFDAYIVTGALEDWMAGRGIASVSVELETRTDSEFERNLRGVKAALELYRK
tara:strand:- start:2703 stop:3593 length:891 start_codon:yes stop_codon:yes gene_type:complete